MRTISIASADARSPGVGDPTTCDTEDGAVRKRDIPLARREFLQGSGILIGVLASGSLLASLAPSPVWAVELQTLTAAQGDTLIAMGRVLYPHDKLPDAVYALLAKDLDAKAASTPATATTLQDGIAALDRAAGGAAVKVRDTPRRAA